MTVAAMKVDQDITIKSSDVNSILRSSERVEQALRAVSGISRAIMLIEDLTCGDLCDWHKALLDTHYHRDHLMETVDTLTSNAFDELFDLYVVIDAAIKQAKSQVEA